jgi:N utilization substance protein A
MITLNNDDIKMLALFEQATGVPAKDYVQSDARVTFVVAQGEAGRAIGRNGCNAKALRGALKKEIEVVEYSPDARQFAANVFKGVRIKNMDMGGSAALVRVEAEDRGIAIGRGGDRVKRASALMERQFGMASAAVRSRP